MRNSLVQKSLNYMQMKTKKLLNTFGFNMEESEREYNL